MSQKILNVFGQTIEPCCHKPLTGFYRDGFCRTGEHDYGRHIVCARLTKDFLNFTKQQGNDLSTPRPEMNFPGLKPDDRWCLCVFRWLESFEKGIAPPVILESCHQSALKFVSLELLKKHAVALESVLS